MSAKNLKQYNEVWMYSSSQAKQILIYKAYIYTEVRSQQKKLPADAGYVLFSAYRHTRMNHQRNTILLLMYITRNSVCLVCRNAYICAYKFNYLIFNTKPIDVHSGAWPFLVDRPIWYWIVNLHYIKSLSQLYEMTKFGDVREIEYVFWLLHLHVYCWKLIDDARFIDKHFHKLLWIQFGKVMNIDEKNIFFVCFKGCD